MKLREAFEAFLHNAVLIDDGADLWQVDNLIDAFTGGDAPTQLDQEVYASDKYIAILDEQGYQITPPMFAIINVGETPYFVSHEGKGYRVKFMIDEEQDRSRYVYGQNTFAHKQAAYRRKDGLNRDWQQHRILGA